MEQLARILDVSPDKFNEDIETTKSPLSEEKVKEIVDCVDLYVRIIDESKQRLEPVKSFFEEFETKLNLTKTSMQTIQHRIELSNKELKEKERLQKDLMPIVNDLIITPNIVKAILNGSISFEWCNHLKEIENKLPNIEIYKKRILEKSIDNISLDLLEKLQSAIESLELKALEKIKKYLIENIKLLRHTSTSSVDIQSKFLKVKYIFTFLKLKLPKLSLEFKSAYTFTIRWYYYYNFVKYVSSLEQLKLIEFDVNTFDASISEYLITIPKRIEQIGDSSDQSKYSILAQIAESSTGAKFNIEQPFQFLLQSVYDNYIIELNFLKEFFGDDSEQELKSTLKTIFTPVFKVEIGFTNWLIRIKSKESTSFSSLTSSTNYHCDFIGILIMINQINKLSLNYKDSNIDNLINSQLKNLTNIFNEQILQLIQNLNTNFASSTLIKSVVSSKTLLIPLRLTQSIASILTYVINIYQSNSQEDLIFKLIQKLSDSFERGMVQLSKSLSSEKQNIFLFVNFQLVSNMLESEYDREFEEFAKHKEITEIFTNHYQKLVNVYK